MLKVAYIALGIISMTAGVIGIILPLVPTTPLVLLSIFCFAKGSKRIEQWITHTKFYKTHLEKYVTQKGLPKSKKIFIQVLSGLMMTATFIAAPRLEVRILLILLFLAQTYCFIFKIRTITESEGIANEL